MLPRQPVVRVWKTENVTQHVYYISSESKYLTGGTDLQNCACATVLCLLSRIETPTMFEMEPNSSKLPEKYDHMICIIISTLIT